jgi:hypothetical protein
MDERFRTGIYVFRTVVAIFPYLFFGKKLWSFGRTLRVIQTGCWNVQTDASWSSSKLYVIEEGPDWNLRRPDGMTRRPDGWCFGQLIVRTAGTEPNFLTCKLCRIFSKHLWIAESLLKSIITRNWFCPKECGQFQTNTILKCYFFFFTSIW